MYDNYNYPLGADGPDAPWNEPSIPEKEFEVILIQTLSKTVEITTNNYELIQEDLDPEDGGSIDTINTEGTDWEEEYHKDHLTPSDLIKELKVMVKNKLLKKDYENNKDKNRLEWLLDECSNWIELELEAVAE